MKNIFKIAMPYLHKLIVTLGGALLFCGICLVELFMWETNAIDPMAGWNGYNWAEISFFVILFLIVTAVVTLLIKGENPILNSVLFWIAFLLSDKVLQLREIIASVTNNETFIYGPNWIGWDISMSCYLGCFAGTVIGIMWSIKRK